MHGISETIQAHKYPTLIIAIGVLVSIAFFQIALRYDLRQDNQKFHDIIQQIYRTLDAKFQLHTEQIGTIAFFGQHTIPEDFNDLLAPTDFIRIATHDISDPDIDNITQYPELSKVLATAPEHPFIAHPYITPNNTTIMPVIAHIPNSKNKYVIGYLNLTKILEQEFTPYANAIHVKINAVSNNKSTPIFRQITDPNSPAYLPETTHTSNMTHKRTYNFDDHSIEIRAYNPSVTVGVLPWIVLLGSLGATALVGYLAIRISTENIKIRRIVKLQTHDLLEQTKQLQASNQDLDDFIHIASHDLKEPLRGIRNYADMLQDDPSDLSNTLKKVYALSTRMDGLINALMEYSIIAREPMIRAPALMSDIAREAARPYKDKPDLNITIHPNLPRVECNSMRVRQALENLISNAIRYNDNKIKTIEIGCTKTHPKHPNIPVFFVRDNGIGIHKDDIETIFKIFRRLHHPDKYGHSFGAGLTQTSRIIHRHNGNIWIEPNEPQGTTVYFTLQRS